MPTITCNGEAKRVPQDAMLIDFIRELKLNPETVVAEHNGTILRREDYDATPLQEGDTLELIRFVGGG